MYRPYIISNHSVPTMALRDDSILRRGRKAPTEQKDLMTRPVGGPGFTWGPTGTSRCFGLELRHRQASCGVCVRVYIYIYIFSYTV